MQTGLLLALLVVVMHHKASVTPGHPFSPAWSNIVKSVCLNLLTPVCVMIGSVVWFAGPVAGNSPLDIKIQEIRDSNLTQEEIFQKVLLLQHRRYCEDSRTCLGLTLSTCGYCRPCYCDDHCIHYSDCCPDQLVDRLPVIPPVQVTLECRANLYGGYTDEQRQARLPNATSFLMAASCPPETSPSLSQHCTSPDNFKPVSVTGSDNGNDLEVFANKFCAQCHGVLLSRAVPWKLMLLCGNAKNISHYQAEDGVVQAAAEKDCFLLYFPPPSVPSPRPCYYDDTMISSCNVTGFWPHFDPFTQRACSAYLDPKAAEDMLFQNVFCYICNSAEPDLFALCERGIVLAPMPFSALLDFSEAIYGKSERRVAARKCQDSQIYDATRGDCRPVVCAPGRHFMDGLCPVLYSSARGLRYSLYFTTRLKQDLLIDGDQDSMNMLTAVLQNIFVMQTLGEATVRLVRFQVSIQTSDEGEQCSKKIGLLGVSTLVQVVSDVSQQDLEEKLLSLRNRSFNLRISSAMEFNFTTNVDEQQRLDETHGLEVMDKQRCMTKISDYRDIHPGDAEASYTRVNRFLTLPKVVLTHDEFQVQTSDLGLKVPWLKDAIPLERYESNADGDIYVSLEDFMPKLKVHRPEGSSASDPHVILSVVCTSLSLAALASTLLTYTLFKPLRTAPGKNNMNLCLALFLAQFCYLVGSGRTEDAAVCQVMGILIHYFWLSAFAAMSVCSYHMWRVFTCLRVADDNVGQRRRCLQYTVYVWGTAAVVVAVFLLTQLIISEGNDIGYGGEQCYLSTPLTVMVAVGMPAALTMTASVVFFWLTVRTIRLSPKLTKSLDDERHVWIYLKLSTLTGATWALTFLIFFTQVEELRYVFTVVSGLQGVFIFLSFVCNRRVGKLYLTRCLPCRRLSTPSSGSSQSCRSFHVSVLSRQTETSFTHSAAGTV